jgi:hypothetical protein
MEENQNAPSLVNHALKNGLILGVISVVITLCLYAIDYTLMGQMKFALLGLLVALGYGIFAGSNYRKEVGGFLPFGKAFQHGFFMFAVSGLVSTIFMILLYNVIDPELPQKLTDASMENTMAMMEGFGMSGDQLDEAMEKARESAGDQFTIGRQLMGYGISLIFSAILALITGAIVKKNQPVSL